MIRSRMPLRPDSKIEPNKPRSRWFFRRRTKEREFVDKVFVHADGMYHYALGLTGDETEAEDLVQDVLARAYAAFERRRPETNHRAWVYTIMRNTFLTDLRKSARQTQLVNADEVVDDQSLDPDEVLTLGGRHGFEDEVLAALESLSESHRTAVVLCDVEGMSYEEIGSVMDCPVGTVRSRIHHARRKLRVVLSEFARKRGLGLADEAV